MANENPTPPNPFNPDPEKKDNNNNNQNPNIPNPNIPNPNIQNNPNQNFGNPYQQGGGYQNPYVSNMGAYNNPNVPPGGQGPQMPVPNSTAVLVLGIISLVGWMCYGIVGLVCSIIALVLSKKSFEAYNANPGVYSQVSYNNLKAGKICSIIGLILSILGVLALIFWVVFMAYAVSQAASNRLYF